MISFSESPVATQPYGSWSPVPDFVAGDDATFFYRVLYHQMYGSPVGACLCKLRWQKPDSSYEEIEVAQPGIDFSFDFTADVKTGTGFEYVMADFSSTGLGTHDMFVTLKVAALGNW